MSAAITAAAQGLKVLVLEKAPRFGGTTARSGGWLWIPGTRLATDQGIGEPAGAARTYLQHEATTHFDAERVDAFLENGPKAIDFFTDRTCVQFDMPPVFPDYHAEAPGGQQGGRSMVTRPFDGRELGERIRDLAPPLPELTVFGMMLGSGKEIWHFMRAFRSLESFLFVARRLGRHFLDVLRHGRGMTLTNGNALAGRLARAAMDLDIPVWLSSPVRELVVDGGRVVGLIVEREGERLRVDASRGVVLACGGFPHDIERRKALFPHAPTGHEHYTPSPESNTGDGLKLAEAVGGWVDATIPNAAAWVPTSVTVRTRRQRGRDAALHRSRQAWRHRGDAQGRALHQRSQLLPRLRAGPGEGLRGRARGVRVAALRPPHAAHLRARLRRVVPDADRAPPAHRLPQARHDAARAGGRDRGRCRRAVRDRRGLQSRCPLRARTRRSAGARRPTTATRATR